MYKEIVVCVNEAEGRDNAITAAAAFANQHNAHLLGVYCSLGEDSPLVPAMGVVSADLIMEAMKQYKERRTASKQRFKEITSEVGCSADWLDDDSVDAPIRAAAYADLIITNQAAKDKARGVSNMSLINRLILESGKPVILTPTGWNQTGFGARIALGWDESREAVRAVADALPLLQQAEQVDVISINYEGDDDIVDISEISTYLAQRNVANSFHLQVTSSRLDSPEKVLSNYCDEHDIDLLVIGAYGHTRLREIVLGGVTRHMIRRSKVPLLLTH
ncbi:MAG: universal stress protein [Gammaproteobacteria bacterium]|nr:universal stress protein [Gammaproteobacteria bacterium]